MLQLLIVTLVHGLYEGGAEEFSKDFATHLTDDSIFIIASKAGKEVPENIISKLEEMGQSYGFKAVYADTYNFAGMSEEEASEIFNEDMKRIAEKSPEIQVSASLALIDILAKDIEKDSEEGTELLEALKSIPYIPNIRVRFKDGEELSFSEDVNDGYEEEEEEYFTIATGRPDRETIISEDDILNLKITLGSTNTVEEFLKAIN